jgi:membrane protein implicated in regulation of membrane protease activity
VDDIPKNKEYETGMRGIALTRLAPGGKARIGDSEAEVFSRDCIINAGTPVEISEIESNKVFVKPLDMDK